MASKTPKVVPKPATDSMATITPQERALLNKFRSLSEVEQSAVFGLTCDLAPKGRPCLRLIAGGAR